MLINSIIESALSFSKSAVAFFVKSSMSFSKNSCLMIQSMFFSVIFFHDWSFTAFNSIVLFAFSLSSSNFHIKTSCLISELVVFISSLSLNRSRRSSSDKRSPFFLNSSLIANNCSVVILSLLYLLNTFRNLFLMIPSIVRNIQAFLQKSCVCILQDFYHKPPFSIISLWFLSWLLFHDKTILFRFWFISRHQQWIFYLLLKSLTSIEQVFFILQEVISKLPYLFYLLCRCFPWNCLKTSETFSD